MARVMADCRRFESESNCSMTIMGTEEEVVAVAAQHAIDAHGHADTPELREEIRSMLEPAEQYSADREPVPFPAG
jgi:Protein of unknown function (DUF1059)